MISLGRPLVLHASATAISLASWPSGLVAAHGSFRNDRATVLSRQQLFQLVLVFVRGGGGGGGAERPIPTHLGVFFVFDSTGAGALWGV